MVDAEAKKNIKGYKNTKRYLKYFGKYKWLCFWFWFFLAIRGVLSFLSPLVLGKMVAYMTTDQDFSKAKICAVIFAGLEVLALAIYQIRVPFFKKLENYVKRDVKMEVIKDSFDINIGEYEKLGNGTFITRLTGDLDSLGTSFKQISETVVNFVSKMGFIVFVYIVSPWVGLFLTGFVLLRYFVYQIRIYYFAKMKPKVLKKNEKTNSMIGESIRGIKDIKTLGLGDNICGRINTLQADYMKADNDEWYVGSFLSNLAAFVSTLCDMSFIFLSIFLIKHGQLDLAIFYSVYIYKNSVMEFAVQLGYLQDYFKNVEVNASRVFDLSNTQKYAHDKYGTVDLPDFKGNIEFENVSFNYVKDDSVLENVSFSIKPNSHIAFVGESGCGKSTIVALICRLYDPDGGKILFDGEDSKTLSRAFSQNISMINQSPYLFNLTIRENMQLVKSDVTDEEIYEVLKFANAYEFVEALPNKLDSFLGEGGTRLSGGQKQRLCIARAMLKNSKVVIFDEATSALDNISQGLVMENVEKIKKDKTIITIAHRLSTIENCDTIYFLDNGKIEDSGTHEYLLGHNEKYARLYNKQKQGVFDEVEVG